MTEPCFEDFKSVFMDFESCFKRLDSLNWRDYCGDAIADSFEGAFIRTVARIHLELQEQ